MPPPITWPRSALWSAPGTTAEAGGGGASAAPSCIAGRSSSEEGDEPDSCRLRAMAIRSCSSSSRTTRSSIDDATPVEELLTVRSSWESARESRMASRRSSSSSRPRRSWAGMPMSIPNPRTRSMSSRTAALRLCRPCRCRIAPLLKEVNMRSVSRDAARRRFASWKRCSSPGLLPKLLRELLLPPPPLVAMRADRRCWRI
mmetsp:Transcript_2323/g.6749  ORF Transcript_2323/g.6749 Transcript_2323/m.6749 type:complete len:201 (+) Transcript_2323:284-886(+)